MNTNTKKPSNAFERLLATSQKNPIYRRYLPISEMFGNLDYRGTYESSLSFHKEEKERNEDVLVKNILDENSDFDAFHDALEQLYQGDGNEEENILCFHSSSLCALLHFYDLKRNTFSLFLRPNHYEVEEKFRPNEVSFEVKRPLFEHSSNIDVCLRGSAGDRDVELNLESKYSEYLKLSRKKKYSLHYLPLFQQYLQNIEGLSCYEEGGMAVLQSSFPRYLEMFKQMIAHFEAISQAKEKNVDSYLGLIVYPFFGKKLVQLQKDYHDLAIRLNALYFSKKVTLLDELLLYGKNCGCTDLKANLFYGEKDFLGCVGPFFVFDNNQSIVASPTTLLAIENERFMNSPLSHDSFYGDLRWAGHEFTLLKEEYYQYPRGRVLFDLQKGKYLVYLDKRIKSQEIIKQIIRVFHLNPYYCELAYDEHYSDKEFSL